MVEGVPRTLTTLIKSGLPATVWVQHLYLCMSTTLVIQLLYRYNAYFSTAPEDVLLEASSVKIDTSKSKTFTTLAASPLFLGE